MKKGRAVKCEQTENDVYLELKKTFEKNLSNMYGQYITFTRDKKLQHKASMKDPFTFFLYWMNQYVKCETQEKFTGRAQGFSKDTPSKCETIYQFMNSLDPYKDMNLTWRVSFDPGITNSISHSALSQGVMAIVLKVASGLFSSAKLLHVGPMSFMASFTARISKTATIVFCIMPERYPVVVNDRVVSYVYSQYIRFLGVAKQETKVAGIINNYLKKIAKHPDLCECFQAGEHHEELFDAEDTESEPANRGLAKVVNFVQKRGSRLTRYAPKLNETTVKIERAESDQIKFDKESMCWRHPQQADAAKTNYVEVAMAREENRRALREMASAASCKWLVSFFEKIPNFRLKLTEEEKTLIGEAGNILAIGRSGTGKTTCALLRLFATEILFKVRSAYANRAILKDTRFNADDVDANCGLHTVFITASPVLTNEVRRYYERLNDKIKQELAKKEKKREAIEKQKELGGAEVVDKSEAEGKKETKSEEGKTDSDPLVRMEEIKEIEDGLEMLDEGEAEKQMALAHTLNAVKDEQFPLFLTVRRLLLMIDGTLRRPFFARNDAGQVIGLEGNADWHNESHGVLMINSTYKYEESDVTIKADEETEDPSKLLDVLEKEEEAADYGDEFDEEERQAEQEKREKRRDNKKQAVKSHYMAKEVDFEIFSKKFWPSIQGRIQTMTSTQTQKLNAASVWREIQTNIKGSIEAHEYAAHHVPIYRYREIASKTTSFKLEAAEKIFDIFYAYERWAYQNNYYDASDLVNHVMSQIRWNGYHGKPIHFIMCDEVQDLTPATLLLLLKLAEQNLFFSGDTAQTIAQGVSFRFGDLKSLFYEADLPSGMPSIMQLTINFRSHARILDLANSVIRALELFFPDSIDKLRKEKSPNDGIMPVVLDSDMQESLFNLLSQSGAPAGPQGTLLARPPLEFGCDQVIIVRNQKAKESLPRFLKHALCLTIYEAKGLEFDDVILYNFFTDSDAKDEWRLLKALLVESVKVPKGFSEGSCKQTFDQLTAQPWLLPEEYKNLKEGEYDLIKNVTSDAKPISLEGKYSALTSELKHLYTAITRPRRRLIIFDENPAVRKPMLDYWLSLGYVKVLGLKQVAAAAGADADPTSKQLVESLSAKNTSRSGWRAQGIRMFRRKYYEQAMKCFEHSGDTTLRTRSEAYFQASCASEMTAEMDTLRYSLEVEGLTREQRKETTKKIEEVKMNVEKAFRTAADMFESMGLKMQAGQCYFSVLDYAKAAKCFEEAELYGQAGEAYFKLEQYMKAGELYEKGKVPTNAIIAYEKAKDWEMVLRCIRTFGDTFSYDHKMKLIKRYIQLALQAAFDEYEAAQEAAAKVRAESKIEHGENQLESSGSLTVSVPVSGEDKAPKVAEDNVSSSGTNPFEEVNASKSSDGNPFEVLNASAANKSNSAQKQKVGEEEEDKKSEFSLLDSASVASKKVVDMDHIASLDPDDEWIKCETGSVIDSVVSGKITASNKCSDYSMLDNAHAFAFSCSLVHTKRDIFVEDQTMSKVIRYVSYFSEDVQKYLDTLRSKSVMLHVKKADEVVPKEKTAADFIVDMDEIDLPFVNLLLDVLETLGLYKLCIIICNRYQINSRIGRYIVAIAHKYSNIKLLCDASEKYVGDNKGTYLEMQAKNSIIANAAIHSVFEVVNPAYLKLKKFMEMVDDSNSLGAYCYKSMLLLGYWKKLVYIMDCDSSLALTSTFADYYNYKMLYAMNFGTLTKANATEVQLRARGCGFDWLPFKQPSTLQEKQALILALDSAIWELSKTFRFTYLHPKLPIPPIESGLVSFPSILPCNQALWNYLLSPKEENLTGLGRVLDVAVKEFVRIELPTAGKEEEKKEIVRDQSEAELLGREVRVWDFCVALMQLLYGAQNNAKLEEFFIRLDSETYNTLLQCVHKLVSMIHSGKTDKVYCGLYYTAYLATLAAFGIRKMEGRDCAIGYGRGFVVHRSSCYFDAASQLTVARKAERRKALEEKITKQMPRELKKLGRLEFEESMKVKLREAMEAEHNALDSAFDMYFSDLDTDYIFVDPNLLTGKICEHIARNVEQITVARIADADLKGKRREKIAAIWGIQSQEALREETRRVALKIGEIVHTLRVLGPFVPKALQVFQARKSKANAAEYYYNAIRQKEEDEKMSKMSKKQKKKAITLKNIELLTESLNSLFFKLQNMSTLLFSPGKHTHINAEDWVLDSIQGIICGLMMQVPECTDVQVFPALCTYLAIDKYILCVEQLRSLQRTPLRWVPEIQTTWLDALAEYKTHCIDDCYLHLLQFLDDNRKELDLYSKIAVVEKVVTMSIVMRGIIAPAGKDSVLIPTNMLKHMEFEKTEGKGCEYRLGVYKHGAATETEDEEIRVGSKRAVEQLIEDISQCYNQNRKKMLIDAVQVMLLALFLNGRDRKDAIELAPLVRLLTQEGQLKLSNNSLANCDIATLSTVYPDDWKNYQDRCRMEPNFLVSVGIHEAEWSFKFLIANVELVHSKALAPNVDQIEKDSQRESKLMATHLSIFKALRGHRPDREFLKLYKHPFNPEKYEATREARAFGESAAARFWQNKASGNSYQLVECVKDTHMMVLNTFYKTPIFTVLDAHYLFTHLDHINEYYAKAIHAVGVAIEGKDGGNASREIREEMERLRTELKIWKTNKFMPDEEYIEKKKIVYRIKWQQHRRKEHQQRVEKRAGQKRQVALMNKASALKGRGKDIFGYNI